LIVAFLLVLIGCPTLAIGACTPAALICPGTEAGPAGWGRLLPGRLGQRCGRGYRRLVGQGARNALAALGWCWRFHCLLAADADAFRRGGVGPMRFGCLLGLREIDVGSNLDLELSGPTHRC
jgi:hypothetical protein